MEHVYLNLIGGYLDFRALIPSLPKKVTVDVMAVLCILILGMSFGLWLWQFMPLISGPQKGNQTQDPFYFTPPDKIEGSPGEELQLKVALSNMQKEALSGVTIRLVETPVVEGAEKTVSLPPRAKQQYSLNLKIRENAPLGEHDITLMVQTSETAKTQTFPLVLGEE